MNIKSEIVLGNVVKYPYIGEHNSKDKMLVLFTSSNSGVCLSDSADNNRYPVGMYRTDWIESSFKVFTGSVTLSI